MYKNTQKKIKEQHNTLKAHHHHKQLYKNQTHPEKHTFTLDRDRHSHEI